MRRSLAFYALPLLAACHSSGPDAQPAGPAGRPHDGAPPYTSAQIRDACADGTALVFAVEQEGAPAAQLIMTFRDGDTDGVEVQSKVIEGEDVLQEASSRSTWDELRSHSTFPAERTTVHEESRTVKAGTYACRVYEVQGEDGGVLDRFWFANGRAGPPVLMEKSVRGAVVYRMELVEVRGDVD